MQIFRGCADYINEFKFENTDGRLESLPRQYPSYKYCSGRLRFINDSK